MLKNAMLQWPLKICFFMLICSNNLIGSQHTRGSYTRTDDFGTLYSTLDSEYQNVYNLQNNIVISVANAQGNRNYQEDKWAILETNNNGVLFGVFD
jgi:hypothetical protein